MVLAEIAHERVRRRPGRHYMRGVKRKMSSYHIATTAARLASFTCTPEPKVTLT